MSSKNLNALRISISLTRTADGYRAESPHNSAWGAIEAATEGEARAGFEAQATEAALARYGSLYPREAITFQRVRNEEEIAEDNRRAMAEMEERQAARHAEERAADEALQAEIGFGIGQAVELEVHVGATTRDGSIYEGGEWRTMPAVVSRYTLGDHFVEVAAPDAPAIYANDQPNFAGGWWLVSLDFFRGRTGGFPIRGARVL